MYEHPSTEFRAHLYAPGFWVTFTVLGLLFVAMSVALAVTALTAPSTLGLDPSGAPGWAFFVAVLLGQFALGALMLNSVRASVGDYLSPTVTVTRVTIEGCSAVRNGQFLACTDEGGRRVRARVPHGWVVRRIPQRAELWRTRSSGEALRLALSDEQRAYSVLDAGRGA